jgi:hypothetical protein
MLLAKSGARFCDIEDEMAELAEAGDINAVAAWCICCLALDAHDECGDRACLLALKGVAPQVTVPSIALAAREYLTARKEGGSLAQCDPSKK